METESAWVDRIVGRYEELSRHAPRCFRCGDRQVQHTDINRPAQWRCRICRYRFEFEPITVTN